MRSDFYVFLMKLQLGTSRNSQLGTRTTNSNHSCELSSVVGIVVVVVVYVALGIFTSGNQNICS